MNNWPTCWASVIPAIGSGGGAGGLGGFGVLVAGGCVGVPGEREGAAQDVPTTAIAAARTRAPHTLDGRT